MISTPMFAFGAPMYYAFANGYNSVTTQVYQNDNGGMVRNFFTKDSANYIPNPYFAFFGIQPQNFACYYGGGGSSSARKTSNAEVTRTPKPESEPVKPTKASPTQKKATTVSNPIQPAKAPETTTTTALQTPSLGKSFVQIARSYSDVSESDGTHHKFCINPNCKKEDPYDQEWCTDFVTYVVKEAYKKAGKSVPAGFGNHDVESLKNWAIANDKFVKTANLRNKASYFIKNIKPGDIFIMNEDGASHTGFVTRIDKSTGVIHTIEGNRDDRVKEYKYSPNNPDLSGFIKLSP